MPVFDFPLSLTLIYQTTLTVGILGILDWIVFKGGFIFLARTISYQLDKLLIGIMSSVYAVFDKLLGGTMFNEDLLNYVLRRVYLFVGVIILFRLILLLMKYLTNPELTSDDKAGVNSLIKRVIIGVMGMLFIPLLFDLMLKFQVSVLNDQVVQQILIPVDILERTEEMHQDGGRFIGTYVMSGFLTPNKHASKTSVNLYNKALLNGDISLLDANRGVSAIYGGKYEYDYIFFISTLVLGYVLFLLLNYALDVAVRFFRLFFYQIIAPIAMVEYMINGGDSGMFAAWKKSVLSTYFMLFTRIISIWFVVLVMTLMSQTHEASAGAKYVKGSLLEATPNNEIDFLLRALIIIAVLGFMKDLPKIIGELFGLDFEQASSAHGIMDKVKGGIKNAALLGAGIVGAGAGMALGTGKSIVGQAKSLKPGEKFTGSHLKKALSQGIKPGLGAMGSQLVGATGLTKALAGGYGATTKGQKEAQQQAQQKEAIAEKRKHLNQGVTPEDKLIRAIQEVELRVAGEKLSDANIANKGYINQMATSKAANDYNRQELAKAAVSSFSTEFQAKIDASKDPIQVKAMIENSKELNEAMAKFTGGRNESQMAYEAKNLNTSGINFREVEGQADLVARYNTSGMGHAVMPSDVRAAVDVVSQLHGTSAENFTAEQKQEVMTKISEMNYARQKEQLVDAMAKESMKITSSVSVTSDISEQTNYTQSVAATSEKILEQVQVQQETVQEEIKPKSKVILPGEENINPNAKIITPEEFRKNPDAKIITPGQDTIDKN